MNLSGLPDDTDIATGAAGGLDLGGLPDDNGKVLREQYRTLQGSPDEAAKAFNLSKRTGLPKPVVERNRAEVERKANEPDWAGLEATAPVTVRELAANTKLFELAVDDTTNLADVERTLSGMAGDIAVTAIKGAVGLPQAVSGLADIFTAGAAGRGLETAGVRFNEAQKILESFYSPAQQRANRAVRSADGFFDTLGAVVQNPSVLATTVGESLPQMLGGMGVARGLLRVAPSLTAVVAGAVGEGVLGAGSAAAQMRAESPAGDLSVKQSAAAVVSGVGTAVFALMGGKLAQRLGIDDIDTALARGGIDRASAEAARKGFVRRLAEGGVSEGVFEELPQSAQEQMWQNFAADRPLLDGVGNAAAMGLLAGATTGAGFSALVGPSAGMDQRKRAADTATRDAEALAQLSQLAAASKLRERDPQTFEQFVAAANEDGPVQDVYLDARTLQQAGVDLQALAQASPAVAAQVQEALTTGGDIVIPVSEYAARVAGTELDPLLTPHLRTSEDALSLDDAQRFYQGQAEEFQKAAQQAMAEREADDAWQASAKAVESQLFAQLKGAGRFTDDVNTAYATLMRDFYVATASRLGITPEEMFQRYPIRVAAESVAGAQRMEQGAPVFREVRPGDTVDGRVVREDVPNMGSISASLSNYTVMPGVREVPVTAFDPEYVRSVTPEKLDKRTRELADQIKVSGEINPLIVAVDAEGAYVIEGGHRFDALLASGAKSLPAVVVLDQDNPPAPSPNQPPAEQPQTLLQRAVGTVAKAMGIETQAAEQPAAEASAQPAGPALDMGQFFQGARDKSVVSPKVQRAEQIIAEVDTSEQTVLYHSGDASIDAELEQGIEPRFGGWLEEVLAGATDDAEAAQAIRDADPVAFYSESPSWVTKKAARALGKSVRDVTAEDIRQNGQLSIVVVGNDDRGVWRAQEDGTAEQFQMVRSHTLGEVPFGVERGDVFTADTFVPEITLTGDDLVQFLQRNAPSANIIKGVLNQPAYHGSPYKFDKFTLDHIGKGEGAQAYGWGLYFAGNRKVAEFYKKKLAEGQFHTVRGEVFNLRENLKNPNVRAVLEKTDGDVDAAIARARQVVDSIPGTQGAEYAVADIPVLEKLKAEGGISRPTGQLYTVDIPEDGNYLLWDKPLSEQPEKVREALAQLEKARGLEFSGDWGELNGALLYSRLSGDASNYDPRGASMALNSLGIAGIKYLDGSSRGQGEGSFNYVIFDDSAIQILDTLYQPRADQGGNRGEIAFGADITQQPSVISLFANADLSTFLHEMGHFQLEVLANIASRPGAPVGVVEDMDRVLKWFGVADLGGWRTMSLEEKRPYHEQFARGFEAYLFEGKAPSAELTGLFARFRAWLVNVYKSVKALNVQISDDIRGVFDRLVATEDAIRQAEAVRAMAPLFPDNPEMQALADEATQSAVDGLQRRSLRDMRWLTNARGRVLKQLQADARDKRKAVEAEVRAEVAAMPVWQAKDWLRANKDSGMADDQVAEMFGFTSGDHMRKAIREAGSRADLVEGMTDQRVLERYGDLASPDAIARAADEAIHNEARARFVATELKALSAAAGPVRAMTKAAKDFAATLVARKKVRDIKPNQHASAEARAAKAAEKAMTAGDTATAANEKRNQLIQNYATRLSYEALDEVDRAVKYLRKFDSEGVRKNLDADYTDQIDALLERFDLRASVTNTQAAKRASLLDWVESQREQGFEPDIPPDLITEAARKPYREMTLEELRGLVDTIKQIEHLGRLKRKLLTAKDEREFAAIRDEIAASIEANAKGTRELRTRNTTGAMLKDAGNRFLAMHRKMASLAREMDGFQDGGPMWDYFIRSMNAAGDRETSLRAEATARLYALVKPLLASGPMGGKGQYFETLGGSFNREERIAIALNMGNAGNMQRLLDGQGWTMDRLQPLLDTITPEEADFVQAVWDFFESYRPQIAEKERRIHGKEPDWVEPVPIALGGKTLRGGYYPIKYDPAASGRAEAFAEAEAARQQMRGAFTTATTRRSFTKSRAEQVSGRPLLYSLAGLYQGTNEVIHDLTWHEWLIDANRLLRSLDGPIRTHYGPETVSAFKAAIQDIAAGDVPAQNVFEKGINHLRVGATVAGLGWNLSTALLQPFGLTQSAVRIGPGWVAKGLAQWVKAPIETGNEVQERSAFMRDRARTMQREINEIQNQIRGNKLDPVRATFFLFIQKAQMVADMPTWLGAYEKAIADGQAEDRAVALADQAVLDAQGGGQTKDLAQIQRGGPLLKLWTNFYSFFNTTYNLAVEKTKQKGGDPKLYPSLALDYLLLFVVPSVMVTLVKAALQGDVDDEDKLVKKLIADQMSYLLGTMVGLREVTAAAQKVAGVEQFKGNYGGPAGLRMLQEIDKLATQTAQGEADAALLKAANNVAGNLFHYPSGAINRAVEGTAAMIEGKTANPASLVFGPPKD